MHVCVCAWRSFYKGFTPCIIRAAPANGIMLLTVDKVGNMLADL